MTNLFANGVFIMIYLHVNNKASVDCVASVACVATVFSTRQSKTPNTENQAQERPSEWR